MNTIARWPTHCSRPSMKRHSSEPTARLWIKDEQGAVKSPKMGIITGFLGTLQDFPYCPLISSRLDSPNKSCASSRPAHQVQSWIRHYEFAKTHSCASALPSRDEYALWRALVRVYSMVSFAMPLD